MIYGQSLNLKKFCEVFNIDIKNNQQKFKKQFYQDMKSKGYVCDEKTDVYFLLSAMCEHPYGYGDFELHLCIKECLYDSPIELERILEFQNIDIEEIKNRYKMFLSLSLNPMVVIVKHDDNVYCKKFYLQPF